MTRPQLTIDSYEREHHLEEGLKRDRLWPQEWIPCPGLERLFVAAFEMQSENAEEPVCSPDQKEAAWQQMSLEGSMRWMANCARGQRWCRRHAAHVHVCSGTTRLDYDT